MAGLISVFVEFVDFRRTGKNTEYGADSVSTVSTDQMNGIKTAFVMN